MANALLEGHANPDIEDRQGATALMIAAAGGNSVIVEALLKAGANPARTNRNGQTAYEIARDQHTAAVDSLKSTAP